MSQIMHFKVDKEFDSKRAGVYLRTVCRLSARTLAVLKRTDGGITRRGETLRTIDVLHTGDIVEIILPRESSGIEPIEGELDILYEDKYLIVVNKPYNTPVHPVKKHQTDTLANYIAYRYKNSQKDFVFRAINRLDSDTSGIVIIAKDRHTASLMQKADIIKNYNAICHGKIIEKGTVNLPIALRPDSKLVREVSDSGKPAVTHFEPLIIKEDRTLLSLYIETGRTHQIRCHLSHIGHPLMGDDLYGGSRGEISRQALHCSSVRFSHPYADEEIFLEVPLPDDISKLI